MSDRPPYSGATNDDGPPTDRRHADRVSVEGYEFRTDTLICPVVDLSIGGLRIGLPADAPALAAGDCLEGELIGGIAKPIALTAQVVWVDADAGQAGCTFPTLGRAIAGDLLEILL